jgi:hypothetical protein
MAPGFKRCSIEVAADMFLFPSSAPHSLKAAPASHSDRATTQGHEVHDNITCMAISMDETTIAFEARRVLDLFEQIIELHEMLRSEGEAAAQQESVDLDGQRGRFRIFVQNLGVFAAAHASLDHRLRHSEEATALVRSLLQSLQWFLSNGLSIE